MVASIPTSNDVPFKCGLIRLEPCPLFVSSTDTFLPPFLHCKEAILQA